MRLSLVWVALVAAATMGPVFATEPNAEGNDAEIMPKDGGLSPLKLSAEGSSAESKAVTDASIGDESALPPTQDPSHSEFIGPPEASTLAASFPKLVPSEKLEEKMIDIVDSLPKVPISADYTDAVKVVLDTKGRIAKGTDWTDEIGKVRPVRRCDYEFALEKYLAGLFGVSPRTKAKKIEFLKNVVAGGAFNPQVPARLCSEVPRSLRAYRNVMVELCMPDLKDSIYNAPESEVEAEAEESDILAQARWGAQNKGGLKKVQKKKEEDTGPIPFTSFRTPTPHSSCEEKIVHRWVDTKGLRDQDVMVTRSTFDKIAHVAFRQTDGFKDWTMTNFRAGLKKCKHGGRSCGRVHAGFRAAWRGLVKNFDAYRHLRRLVKDGYEIVFTGHSLGAGVAQYAAVATALSIEGAKVSVEAFGSSRVGDAAFAKVYNEVVHRGVRQVAEIKCTMRGQSKPEIWPDFIATMPAAGQDGEQGYNRKAAMLATSSSMSGGETDGGETGDAAQEKAGSAWDDIQDVLASAKWGATTSFDPRGVDADGDNEDDEHDDDDDEDDEHVEGHAPRAVVDSGRHVRRDTASGSMLSVTPGVRGRGKRSWWMKFKQKLWNLSRRFRSWLDKTVNDDLHLWFIKTITKLVDGYEHTKGFTPIPCDEPVGTKCSSRAEILKSQLACHGMYYKYAQNGVVNWAKGLIRDGKVKASEIYPLQHGNGRFEEE